VAGAGSLISFPSLVGFGLPSLTANATNFVALLPGRVSSFLPFRGYLSTVVPHLKLLMLPTVVGAAAGSWMLVSTSERLFRVVVPFLILGAAVLLAFQPRIKAWAKRNDRHLGKPSAVALQFLTSLYGGYFGAGIGIMMLATFALTVEGSLNEQNALKIVFALVISVISSAVVLQGGLVDPWAAGSMLAGGLLGGYYAGRWMLKMDEDKLRGGIVALGLILAAYYAVQEFLPGLVGRIGR